jgi:hypothetical protein
MFSRGLQLILLALYVDLSRAAWNIQCTDAAAKVKIEAGIAEAIKLAASNVPYPNT